MCAERSGIFRRLLLKQKSWWTPYFSCACPPLPAWIQEHLQKPVRTLSTELANTVCPAPVLFYGLSHPIYHTRKSPSKVAPVLSCKQTSAFFANTMCLAPHPLFSCRNPLQPAQLGRSPSKSSSKCPVPLQSDSWEQEKITTHTGSHCSPSSRLEAYI